MILTEYEIDNLYNTLKNTCKVLEDIKKPIKNKMPVYHSRAEYLDKLRSEDKLPDELYQFKYKEVYITITFSESTNKYHIVCKNFNSKILENEYKTFRSTSYIVGETLKKAIYVFSEVIKEYFDRTIAKDVLF